MPTLTFAPLAEIDELAAAPKLPTPVIEVFVVTVAELFVF